MIQKKVKELFKMEVKFHNLKKMERKVALSEFGKKEKFILV
jgi:hypothetical protein